MLEVRGLRGGYGEVEILKGIDLSVAETEIVTIAGTNGSGKSTLGKGVMGLLPRMSGSLLFGGKDLARLPAEGRIKLGLFYVPQVANVFPSLSVYENLQVVKATHARERIEPTLERFPALRQRLRNRAGTLSGGERQQLAIARGLVASARIMILDEPTANLAPAVMDQVLSIIEDLPSQGCGVLLIEQRAREAFSISARGYIMHLGEIVASGDGTMLDDPSLGSMFFGLHSH
ncbi:MAG TPA: ABC transporter ATP-binding protein [Xanthobacteraceae bacterium]|nr:ABC transporter ATP-binding protein [Xanthobacteraceae bacterium]